MPFSNIVGASHFAQGVLTYSDHFGNDPQTRLVVPIIVDGQIATAAILDTGAPWCILNPEEANALQNFEFFDWLGEIKLRVRGLSYTGQLCRLPVTLVAEIGTNLTIEATFFIPSLKPNEEWLHPNFLGLDSFLHRIRFAVDPQLNHFYFGADFE